MDKTINPPKPEHLFILFFFLLVFVASIFPITDNDVWWHLKSGQIIWQDKAIPTRDIFSFTISGKDWISHEWLSDTVFYLVYSLFSLAGITVFKAFIALLTFIVMYRSVKEKEAFAVWIIFALALFAMRDGLRERPQVFTYLFTALYVYLLRSKKNLAIGAIPLLQVLWVNLHGAASVVGIGLVALFALFEKEARPALKAALISAVLAAELANPRGYGIFTYLYASLNPGITGLVMEFRHPVLAKQFAAYFILFCLCALSFAGYGKKLTWQTLALILAALGSVTAIRHIPVFAVMAAPVTAENISALLKRYPSAFPEKMDFKTAAAFGLMLTLFFWIAGNELDVSKKYRFGAGDAHKSKYAVNFMKWCELSGFKGNVFNDYDFGGYILWKLYPMHKVFIDGRLIEYGRELAERSFYFWKPEVWRELEKQYDLTAAIITNERYYSCRYLDSRKDWVLVYWDDDALVYFKDIPQNRRYTSNYGYRFLKPNSPDQGYLKREPAENVLFEIERSLYFSPASRKAEWMKAFLTTQNATSDQRVENRK